MSSWDVIIAGGGPAGCTAGILLGRAGLRVLILEREKFPRFHIGESLLPYGNGLLRELGVWDRLVRDGFVPKFGADFVAADSAGMVRSDFGRFLGAPLAHTFQVDRASFDAMLMERAREEGCEVREETRGEIVELGRSGVQLRAVSGGGTREESGRWLVDAAGRGSLAGRFLALGRTGLGMAKRIAVFSHFEGVRRNEGKWEGNTTVVRREDGWFWIIPLREGRTSVGLIQELGAYRRRGLEREAAFARAVAESAEMRYRMDGAREVGGWHVESDYTFRHLRLAGERWILAGDAAGFIDPIFSSGVRVAMESARDAARLVMGAAAAGRGLTGWERFGYRRRFERMTGRFLRMIKTFYDDRGFEVFMNPGGRLDMQRAVVDIVGGNTSPRWDVLAAQELFFLACRVHGHFRLVPPLPVFVRARGEAPAPVQGAES